MNKVETLIFIFVAVFLMGAASVMFSDNHVIKIDCRNAEISPDISQSAKELCRKLKASS